MRWVAISLFCGLAAIFLAPLIADAAKRVMKKLNEESPPPDELESDRPLDEGDKD